MTDRKAHLDAFAVVTIVFCCFLWGLNQVAAKAAMPEIPALWQAAARSVGGALLVWLWAASRGTPLFDADRTLPGGLLAGVLFAAEFFCIFVGLQFTTASRMVVWIYIAPFVVALGMPLIAHSERLSPLQAAGLVLAFAGVAWAFAEGFSQPHGPDAMAGRRPRHARRRALGRDHAGGSRHPPRPGLGREDPALPARRLGGAAAGGGGPVGRAAAAARLSTLAWMALLFQVVIVTFASYLLWFWLVRHYPATRLSSFTMLTPVFGLLLGAVLLTEPVTGRLLFALATVAAGIFIVNRKARDRAAGRDPRARRPLRRPGMGAAPARLSPRRAAVDRCSRRDRCWRDR